MDTVEEKAIVAIRPKVAFQPIYQIATTFEGSDSVFTNQPSQAINGPAAAGLCFWWRWGESKRAATNFS